MKHGANAIANTIQNKSKTNEKKNKPHQWKQTKPIDIAMKSQRHRQNNEEPSQHQRQNNEETS